MRYIKLLTFLFLVALVAIACGNQNEKDPNEDGHPDNGNTSVAGFAQGADISWVTEMEQKGMKFYNTEGKATDCFQLMKDLGLNAVRLRVWVNPDKHGNWCDKDDFLVKAKRAAKLGMDVMVDFHYSDWWADPGQQHKPAAWKGLNLADLKKAIATHTTDVLNALKSAGITPKWVQVGNEIRPGMLWDEDVALSGASYDVRECDVKDSGSTSTKVKYPKNFANLATFINAGYDAVKAVFPSSIVIVHLDNGYDQSLYNWFFDELKKNSGKWDMIGMSIYPYWTMLEHKEYTPERTITECIDNIKKVSAKYNCDVMIVETGMECADTKGQLATASILQEGKKQLARLLKECRENTNDRCKGVFYWEPECRPSQYRLGAFTENGYPTVIMDAFK